MEIPKFLVGDNTECQDSVFIIHTESPRFILNLDTDDVKWLDDELPELLGTDDEAELTAPVRWTQTMHQMIADGVSGFTEVGPGKILQGLVKKVDRQMPTESAEL